MLDNLSDDWDGPDSPMSSPECRDRALADRLPQPARSERDCIADRVDSISLPAPAHAARTGRVGDEVAA